MGEKCGTVVRGGPPLLPVKAQKGLLRFVTGARKFIRAKIFKLNILKKAIQKVVFAKNLREIARKFVPNFELLWKVRENNKSAQKFLK